MGVVISLAIALVIGITLFQSGLVYFKGMSITKPTSITISILDKNNTAVANTKLDIISAGRLSEKQEYETNEKGQFTVQNCVKDTIIAVLKLENGTFKVVEYSITGSYLTRGYAVIILGEEA